MSDWKKMTTTAEVWNAIMVAHRDRLVVFSSFSAPGGDFYGRSAQGRMYTAYGFPDSSYPLIEATTTWDIHAEDPIVRHNEKHEYWLCLPQKEDD